MGEERESCACKSKHLGAHLEERVRVGLGNLSSGMVEIYQT